MVPVSAEAELVDVLIAEESSRTPRGQNCNGSGNIDILRHPRVIKVIILMIYEEVEPSTGQDINLVIQNPKEIVRL